MNYKRINKQLLIKLGVFYYICCSASLFSQTIFVENVIFEEMVGIGTNNPTSKLHVAGELKVEGVSSSDKQFKVVTNYGPALVLQTTTDNYLYSAYLDSSGTRRTWSGLNNDLSKFWINVENGTDGIVLSGGDVTVGTNNKQSSLLVRGNVGVGTVSPKAKLHVVGDAIVDGALTLEPQGDIPMFGM